MANVILTGPSYAGQTWISSNSEYFLLGKDSYIIDSGLGLDASTTGHNRVVQIDGSITSTGSRGLVFGDSSSPNTSTLHTAVFVGQNGAVRGGDNAIQAFGNNTYITNHGVVSSTLSNGLEISGTSFALDNFGSIASGGNYGVRVVGDYAQIRNSGSIQGDGSAVLVSGTAAAIQNSGEIITSGSSSSIYANGSGARVNNSGDINSAGSGLETTGWNYKFLNSGTITAATDGIRVHDTGYINNSGTINGGDSGIYYIQGATRMDDLRLINSGVIQGATDAIQMSNGGGPGAFGRLVLKNSGEIIGDIKAITPTFNVDDNPGINDGHQITNTGEIVGNITFGNADDVYKGGKGLVTGIVSGNRGDDTLVGGSEDNSFNGGVGNDTLKGMGGDDTLNGDEGNDTIRGGAGEDSIDGGDDNDTIRGGAGDDDIQGGSGEDNIRGGAGDDTIDGGLGRDTLRGGAGNDTLNGFHQWDVLIGGKGDDVLTGGFGNDTFVFGPHDGHDRITDFVNGQDRIDLSALGLNAADYATVVAPALSGAGANVTLLDMTQLGGTGTVRIEGLAIADADVSDFIF
jgi:Ca2+-binding RTX toxin-like protein